MFPCVEQCPCPETHLRPLLLMSFLANLAQKGLQGLGQVLMKDGGPSTMGIGLVLCSSVAPA